jgi:hypothetical protein
MPIAQLSATHAQSLLLLRPIVTRQFCDGRCGLQQHICAHAWQLPSPRLLPCALPHQSTYPAAAWNVAEVCLCGSVYSGVVACWGWAAWVVCLVCMRSRRAPALVLWTGCKQLTTSSTSVSVGLVTTGYSTQNGDGFQQLAASLLADSWRLKKQQPTTKKTNRGYLATCPP